MVIWWDFMGIYPLVVTNIVVEDHHFEWGHPLYMIIFNSYVFGYLYKKDIIVYP